MTLRRKLLTLLGSLTTTALLLVAVGIWTSASQQTAHEELEQNLHRSLILQRIDSSAMDLRRVLIRFADDPVGAPPSLDAREASIRADFEQWAALPERAEFAEDRLALERTLEDAIREAREILRLLSQGELEIADERLALSNKTGSYAAFLEGSQAQKLSNESERGAIRKKVEKTRAATQVGLALATVAVLSLVFLFAAYLGGELFRPLRDLASALDHAARGERRLRLDEGRDDELGAVSRGFNRLMEALEADLEEAEGRGSEAHITSARADLQRRVTGLRKAIAEAFEGDASVRADLEHRIERMTESLERMTSLTAPTDLIMQHVDLAALLHEVFARFHITFASRAIGVEIIAAAELCELLADRDKLKAALTELLRTAIDALPERGGRVGARAIDDPDEEGWVIIEIADDGPNGDARRYERALAGDDGGDDASSASLALAFDIIAAHGGKVEIDAEAGRGARTVIRLPAG